MNSPRILNQGAGVTMRSQCLPHEYTGIQQLLTPFIPPVLDNVLNSSTVFVPLHTLLILKFHLSLSQ